MVRDVVGGRLLGGVSVVYGERPWEHLRGLAEMASCQYLS